MGYYAPVIRATDYPVPPASAGRADRTARPGSPDRSDDDMYVYRDPRAQASYLADQRAQERDIAYWYDLSLDSDDPEREEARGPFEPLLPSNGPPPNANRPQPTGPGATPAGIDDDLQAQPDEAPEEPAYAQARRLEQIKDLYLTAEAIGEENVDKHFDQLLAQQRELISDYFRQSAAARHAGGLPAQAGTPEGAPEGAGVAAEPPRYW
ncbi:MAG TPA: hypothetical protein VME19_16790 [Streptosporangiaceae bacterium]|nr:hypothetical protein [Streptosporangiaceae bacterium]